MGGDLFVRRYGFGPSKEYLLWDQGQSYDSKAILGVALRHATGKAASSSEFHGGVRGAAQVLTELGFTVFPISASATKSERPGDDEWREASEVGAEEAQAAWATSAHEALREVAGRYHGLVTQKEFAGLVQMSSGIRTTSADALLDRRGARTSRARVRKQGRAAVVLAVRQRRRQCGRLVRRCSHRAQGQEGNRGRPRRSRRAGEIRMPPAFRCGDARRWWEIGVGSEVRRGSLASASYGGSDQGSLGLPDMQHGRSRHRGLRQLRVTRCLAQAHWDLGRPPPDRVRPRRHLCVHRNRPPQPVERVPSRSTAAVGLAGHGAFRT